MSAGAPELTPELYDHLRNLARRIYGEHGRGHETVQPTVLLHEAWAKVARSSQSFESRSHFMAVAARAMRQILVDRARTRGRLKRGGGAQHTTLGAVGGEDRSPIDVLALDRALSELEGLDPDAAQVVMMRTFGGMTVQEVAQALDVSPRTVDRTWRFARAYLRQQLSGDEGGGGEA